MTLRRGRGEADSGLPEGLEEVMIHDRRLADAEALIEKEIHQTFTVDEVDWLVPRSVGLLLSLLCEQACRHEYPSVERAQGLQGPIHRLAGPVVIPTPQG